MTTLETAISKTENHPIMSREQFQSVRSVSAQIHEQSPTLEFKKNKKKIRSLKHYDAKVLKFLEDNPGWHRLNDIGDAVGYEITGTSRSSFYRRIDVMIEKGKILKNKKNSSVFFAIAKTNSSDLKWTDAPGPDPTYDTIVVTPEVEAPLFTFTYYADHVRLSYEDALKITQELAAGQ